jgi:hypothetical protein
VSRIAVHRLILLLFFRKYEVRKNMVTTTTYFVSLATKILKIKIKYLVPAFMVLGFLGFLIINLKLIKVPSDVPITHIEPIKAPVVYDRCQTQEEQNDIVVDSLEVKLISNPLSSILVGIWIVQYQLVGSVTGVHGKRPVIKTVQFCLERRHDYGKYLSIGTIYLTPIIGVSDDESYDGGPVNFNIKIGDYLASLDWGKNEFYVHAGKATTSFRIVQKK